MAEKDFEPATLSNSIESSLKNDLDSAVGNSEHSQREILSAAIENILEPIEVEGQRVVVIDEEKIEEELEKYGDLYG